jgi:archaellum component FlaC
MRTILLSLLAAMLPAVTALASDEGAIVARAIETHLQVQAIQTEMRDTVGGLSDEKRAYELALRELDTKPKTRDQLNELATEISRQTESLKRFQANIGSEDAIDYCKRRIRDLTLILEASKLKTDTQRDAYRQKLQPKIDKLTEQIRSIEAPFRERVREVQGSADAGNEDLAAVIRPHIKTPESTYPGSTVEHFNATVHMAFGSSNWNDSEGEQVAWAHIRIRPLDQIQDYHREKLLAGKYPIQSLSDGSIWVWAGHFLITFVADDEKLKGEENIQQAVQQFVDLEGLAAIHTETESVATGAVVE